MATSTGALPAILKEVIATEITVTKADGLVTINTVTVTKYSENNGGSTDSNQRSTNSNIRNSDDNINSNDNKYSRSHSIPEVLATSPSAETKTTKAAVPIAAITKTEKELLTT